MHLKGSGIAGRRCLIRDGWCRVAPAPLISLQDLKNLEHGGHVREEESV
jgi:hypothetical protein